MASASYRKMKNENTAEQADNITPHGFQHENEEKA